MEESDLLKKRKEKIEALKAEGIDLYPNDVKIRNTTEEILSRFSEMSSDQLAQMEEPFRLAGRIMAVRNFGKAAFISLQDRKGRLQGYIHRQIVGEAAYQLFKKLDVGDIVMIEGRVFRTKTGELTIEAGRLRLLSKAIRPLPEKWHGLTDIETRYRQRHLDLIVNPRVKDVFQKRSRIIQSDSTIHGRTGFSGGGNADDAAQSGRRRGQAFQDLSSRAGNGSLPPDRPGALPETACHRGAWKGFLKSTGTFAMKASPLFTIRNSP